MTQMETASHAAVAFARLQYHPQSAPVASILLAAAFFIVIFLLFRGLQKIPGRNPQFLITAGLIPVSVYLSRIFDPIPWMQSLVSLTGNISGDLLQFFGIILMFVGIMFLNLIVQVIPWALAVLIPVFIFHTTLTEPGLGKEVGICAVFTLLAGIGIHLLILLTPVTWLSVFSYDPAPGTISEPAIQCGGLLVTFLIASAGYYGIRTAKVRVSFVKKWLPGE